jgi:hypothetical protein
MYVMYLSTYVTFILGKKMYSLFFVYHSFSKKMEGMLSVEYKILAAVWFGNT